MTSLYDAISRRRNIDGAVAAYCSWRTVDKSNFIGYMFPESVHPWYGTDNVSNEIRENAENIMTWPASARSEFLIRISRVPERSA